MSDLDLPLDLPLVPPYEPMEAETADVLPAGDGWQYEPKWDGFRCLAFRDGDDVRLQSKSGKPLGRYFPDVVAGLSELGARRFVLDGELVIEVDGALSFEELQLRLHPAASRVEKLAAVHPALFITFDLLVTERRRLMTGEPLSVRRERLERFAGRYFPRHDRISLSPATRDPGRARGWLEAAGGALDGVIAKRLDAPYRSGERTGMVKVKNYRSADCVVGGYRRAEGGGGVGSLLLGLYGDDGLLHHVGYTSSFTDDERRELVARVEPLESDDEAAGFTGRSPGGPSRWSRQEREWQALRHELVAEVEFDHVSGGRFRHGTKLLRWRPDKSPSRCTFDQLPEGGPPPALLGV